MKLPEPDWIFRSQVMLHQYKAGGKIKVGIEVVTQTGEEMHPVCKTIAHRKSGDVKGVGRQHKRCGVAEESRVLFFSGKEGLF